MIIPISLNHISFRLNFQDTSDGSEWSMVDDLTGMYVMWSTTCTASSLFHKKLPGQLGLLRCLFLAKMPFLSQMPLLAQMPFSSACTHSTSLFMASFRPLLTCPVLAE